MKTTRSTDGIDKVLSVAIKNLEGKIGKVGWLGGSNYPDGTPVAEVAAKQEYGDPSEYIPARPFMRPTISEKQSEWREIADRGVKAVIKNRSTIADVMEAIGLKAAGDIRKKIASIFSPPLAPATIAARLRKRANKKHVGALDKPLIDTGFMYGTCTNSVENSE